jgi:hypothetical protein
VSRGLLAVRQVGITGSSRLSLNGKLAAGPSGLRQYLLYVNALSVANSRLRLLRGEAVVSTGRPLPS